MSSHAKASTAGSTQRQATGLGRIFRGALATRVRRPVPMGVVRRRAVALWLARGHAGRAFAGGPGALVAPAAATLTRHPEGFSPLDDSSSARHLPSTLAHRVDEATKNVFASEGEGSTGGEWPRDPRRRRRCPRGARLPLSHRRHRFFHGNTPAFLVYRQLGHQLRQRHSVCLQQRRCDQEIKGSTAKSKRRGPERLKWHARLRRRLRERRLSTLKERLLRLPG